MKKTYKLYDITKIECTNSSYGYDPTKYFDENFKTLFICNLVGKSASDMTHITFNRAKVIIETNKGKYEYKIVIPLHNLKYLFKQTARKENYKKILEEIKDSKCEVLLTDNRLGSYGNKESLYFNIEAETLTETKLKEVYDQCDNKIKSEKFLVECLKGKTLKKRPKFLGKEEKIKINEIPCEWTHDLDTTLKNLDSFFEIEKNSKVIGTLRAYDKAQLTDPILRFLKLCNVYNIDLSNQPDYVQRYYKEVIQATTIFSEIGD